MARSLPGLRKSQCRNCCQNLRQLVVSFLILTLGLWGLLMSGVLQSKDLAIDVSDAFQRGPVGLVNAGTHSAIGSANENNDATKNNDATMKELEGEPDSLNENYHATINDLTREAEHELIRQAHHDNHLILSGDRSNGEPGGLQKSQTLRINTEGAFTTNQLHEVSDQGNFVESQHYVPKSKDSASMIREDTDEHDAATSGLVLASAGARNISRLAFIRIQKTGSSTLAERIIPTMCKMHEMKCSRLDKHLDWTLATNRALKTANGSGAVITMLRDPVERLLSEFFMVRKQGKKGNFLDQDQWDVHPKDIEKLKGIVSQSDQDKALYQYINFPDNPSRNRQTLYLLGFQRTRCRKGTKTNPSCCGICSKTGDGGYPARAYNWSTNGPDLLERAKGRLESLTAWGIHDCFNDSIHGMAGALGWNQTRAVLMSNEIHVRGGSKKAAGSKKSGGVTNTARGTWQKLVATKFVNAILEMNLLDVQLVAFARKRYYELHGRHCNQP